VVKCLLRDLLNPLSAIIGFASLGITEDREKISFIYTGKGFPLLIGSRIGFGAG
jgi:hypothetical protein